MSFYIDPFLRETEKEQKESVSSTYTGVKDVIFETTQGNAIKHSGI